MKLLLALVIGVIGLQADGGFKSIEPQEAQVAMTLTKKKKKKKEKKENPPPAKKPCGCGR